MFAQLETSLSDFQANIKAVSVDDSGTPRNMFGSNQRWAIRLEWELTGTLAESLDAEFRVTVGLRSIGRGQEIKLPQLTALTLEASLETDETGHSIRRYVREIAIAPYTAGPGVYRIVTHLLVVAKKKDNPVLVSGLVEGSMVQVYNTGA